MSDSKSIGVGLIGLGVVGGGVARILQEREDHFRKVRKLNLNLRRVAVRDLKKSRSVSLPDSLLTDRPQEIIDDPEIQIVIEVIGGIEPANSLCFSALKAGKDVVTANKALLAEQGSPLFEVAAQNEVTLAFEASVCGGIPIIQALSEGLAANKIESIYGILNGTTNYIMTRMADEGGNFETMLEQAQEKGFAEADPTMDIDGTDAAQKLALLCRLAYRVSLNPNDILKEGISHITAMDIDFARELGYTIKLLGIAKDLGAQIEARVHPAMVPSRSLLANIKDEFNAVEVVGSATGPQVFYGRGAGELPTASAIVADLLTIAERRKSGRNGFSSQYARLPQAIPLPAGEIESSYYCRFTVNDHPGVLARIAQVFSVEGISIETVIQHGRSETQDGTVPLMMTTHNAFGAAMSKAVGEIDQLPFVTEKAQIIRIEQP